MQLPSVDRQPGLRPAGVDLVSSNGHTVIPVAPVNPPVTAASGASAVPPTSVVNRIGAASGVSNPVYDAVHYSVPDPIRRGTEPAAEPNDWTIQRPEPEKAQDPPPVPMHQLLLDFIKSMWQASGMVVEVSQAQKQNTLVNPANPGLAPGDIARENLTYQPSKIKKTENI
ncbi:MAG: hypothetical protein ABIR55_14495 [Burkholderiaceae bacterium]